MHRFMLRLTKDAFACIADIHIVPSSPRIQKNFLGPGRILTVYILSTPISKLRTESVTFSVSGSNRQVVQGGTPSQLTPRSQSS
jgi:hypothetical protein